MVSATTKYWVLALLDIVIAVASYFENQPQITEGTIIGGVLVAVPLIIHDLEDEGTTPTPPAPTT